MLDFYSCQFQSNGFGFVILPTDGFGHLRCIEMALARRIRTKESKINLRKNRR